MRSVTHVITNLGPTAVRSYNAEPRIDRGIKSEHTHATLAFFRPVIEEDAAVAFIASATRYTFRTIVHREWIAPFEFVGLLFRDNLSEQAVAWTFPDAGIVRDWSHPMSIARVRAPNFTERIWAA